MKTRLECRLLARAKILQAARVVVGGPEWLVQLAIHFQGVAGVAPFVLGHVDDAIFRQSLGTLHVDLRGAVAQRGQKLVHQRNAPAINRIRRGGRLGFVEKIESFLCDLPVGAEAGVFHFAELDERAHFVGGRSVEEAVVFLQQRIDVLVRVPPEPGDDVGIEMAHSRKVQAALAAR